MNTVLISIIDSRLHVVEQQLLIQDVLSPETIRLLEVEQLTLREQLKQLKS